MTAAEITAYLKTQGSRANVEGMAKFGISSKDTLGVSMPVLRKLGRSIGKDHQIALDLFDSGIHEARILAALVDDPKLVTEGQMETWVKHFDSWDVADQVCTILFDKTRHAWKKAAAWADREKEYEKRAAYSLMAGLAVHDRGAANEQYERLLPFILRGATDGRNYVKKAVSWALRAIGKRNAALCKSALSTAKNMSKLESKSAKWVASDAIRELTSVRAGKKTTSPKRGGRR